MTKKEIKSTHPEAAETLRNLLRIFSMGIVLHVTAHKDKGANKAAWVFLPLLFPLFGGAFYLLYHFQPSTKRFSKALLDIKEESQVMYCFPGEAFEAAVCMVLIRGQFPAFSFRQTLEVTFLGVFANVSTLFAGVVPMQNWYLPPGNAGGQWGRSHDDGIRPLS